MTRERFIELYKQHLITRLIDSSVASEMLLSYCLDRGKPYYESGILVTYLLGNPDMLQLCFQYAIDYYTDKYNIYVLWSKESSKLLSIQVRTVLLIY